MNIDAIKTAVLNPQDPVDLEFEFILLGILGALEKLDGPQHSSDYDVEVELCKGLRTSLTVLKNKIANYFGKQYRGNKGGQVLVDLAAFGVELLSRNGSNKDIQESVQAHFEDIKRVNESLPDLKHCRELFQHSHAESAHPIPA